MGYEDRDYFQSKPKFELSAGLRPATKGLMIAVIASYLIALIVGNNTNFADPAFWLSTGAGGPMWIRRIAVLTSFDTVPWLKGFAPGYWKLLTHWLVPPDLLRCILDVVSVFFAGRMLEELFGSRRYLLLFAAFGVVSGLLASLTDHFILGDRFSVIMGPVGAVFGLFITVAWIAPHQRTFLGWKLRPFALGLIGIFGVLGLVTALASGAPVVASPTQLLWGAACGAAYMTFLKSRNRVPSLAPGSYQEAWNKRNNLPEDVDDISRAIASARKEDEKDREAADKRKTEAGANQQKLDAILEKISKQGISSLSRGEKAFLDQQSKRRKP